MNIFKFFAQSELKNRYDVQRYHLQPEIGHSKLVNFETKGPTTLSPSYTVQQTDAMLFGSIVDALLTQSQSFNEDYYVINGEYTLTPSEERFVQYCIDNEILLDTISDERLLQIMDICSFNANMTKNVSGRIEKTKKLRPLIQERMLNVRKIQITKAQFTAAADCVAAIQNSDVTKHLFEDNNHVFYQVSLCDERIKGLLDIVYVDPVQHKIHPFDLKCVTYPEREFVQNSFYKYKYYRQAEMYTKLLNDVVNTMLLYTPSETWTVEPFKFLVINKDSLSPLIYSFPVVYDACGQLKITDNKTVRSYYDVVREMRWHINNGQYMYSRDIYLSLLKQSKQQQKDFVTIPIITADNVSATDQIPNDLPETSNISFTSLDEMIEAALHEQSGLLEQFNSISNS